MYTPRFVAIPALAAVFFTFGGQFAALSAQGVTERPHPATVLQRVEPIGAAQPAPTDSDRIVVMQVTVQPSGELALGPVEMVGRSGRGAGFAIGPGDAGSLQQILQRGPQPSGGAAASDLSATLGAIRAWRFQPATEPFTTVVGFNLARTEQSGLETEPVRIGGTIPVPRKVRDVPPRYPAEAQARQIQGLVILELTIDGAGVPVTAYALRPVEGLTMAAATAALQWRFEPDASYSRRLMTVTVNFPLAGTAAGINAGGVNAGGMTAQAQSSGGVPGAAALPPSSSLAPVRVGGNIAQPTKTKHVDGILPETARQAGIQGVVILEIIIAPDGKVQDAKILRSIRLLDQAALDAVRQWEYTPTLLNGTPVPVIMTVTVNFVDK